MNSVFLRQRSAVIIQKWIRGTLIRKSLLATNISYNRFHLRRILAPERVEQGLHDNFGISNNYFDKVKGYQRTRASPAVSSPLPAVKEAPAARIIRSPSEGEKTIKKFTVVERLNQEKKKSIRDKQGKISLSESKSTSEPICTEVYIAESKIVCPLAVINQSKFKRSFMQNGNSACRSTKSAEEVMSADAQAISVLRAASLKFQSDTACETPKKIASNARLIGRPAAQNNSKVPRKEFAASKRESGDKRNLSNGPASQSMISRNRSARKREKITSYSRGAVSPYSIHVAQKSLINHFSVKLIVDLHMPTNKYRLVKLTKRKKFIKRINLNK